MSHNSNAMECRMFCNTKPPNITWWLMTFAAPLVLASSLRAQETSNPAFDLSDVAAGMQQVISPNLAPAQSEQLPAPQPEPGSAQFIPMRSNVDPNAIQVANDDGLVRLVVRDAPLRQVLALLAESQKLNLVFSSVSDVNVTVSLDRVQLATALDAILSSCGHTWTRNGNIIHVTQVGEGVAVGPSAQGRCLEVFELDFAAAADIDLAVKGLLSPVGKSWITQSSPADNRRTREVIAVEDLPEYVRRIAAYIAQSDQPPRQVMVEVQILEVRLSDDRACGVDFHKLADLSGNGIRFATTGFDALTPQDNPGAGKAFFFSVHGTDMSVLVQMLQETSDAKTLASPKLLAVNGQESHIQIGEKLPYRLTTTTQTSTQESVQFLDTGVILRFTPWITRDGRVLLRIAPKVSKGAINANSQLPEEATTEVQTDAFLADGQGIVIGGLIRETDTVDQSKVPVLGDIPYAGALFQRRASVRSRSEIIIAIMPHLLPYRPQLQAINDMEVERARDPLVYGPLCRNPRPYEPRLPDIAGDVNRKIERWMGSECADEEGCETAPGHMMPPPSKFETVPAPALPQFPQSIRPTNTPKRR